MDDIDRIILENPDKSAEQIGFIVNRAASSIRARRRGLKMKGQAISPPQHTSERIVSVAKDTGKAKMLFFDIETLPNVGYFFDVYSDRGIPLDFIKKPKAIVSLAYKFTGDEAPTVLLASEPYNDSALVKEFSIIAQQADYLVAHYGDGFDIPFIEARLAANKLPPLPPVKTVDTYKLAKRRFKSSLNSNRLDHLGDILGLGRKNKTDAKLWVRCAEGEIEALQEMAEYNAQDIELLEAVYNQLSPNFKSAVNQNILHDDTVKRCKPCGSENLELKGHELKNSTFQHRYQCNDCGAWSTFARTK